MQGRWSHSWLVAVCVALTPLGAQAQSAEQLQVHDVWVRESAANPATAAYFVIENTSPQSTALVEVRTAAAGLTELHTMRMMQKDGREMMSMAQVADVPVPANGRTELKPGGFHVMLFKLAQPLSPGATVALTLRFANGVTKSVSATVRPMMAPGGMGR